MQAVNEMLQCCLRLYYVKEFVTVQNELRLTDDQNKNSQMTRSVCNPQCASLQTVRG